jgi:hypothetical protein
MVRPDHKGIYMSRKGVWILFIVKVLEIHVMNLAKITFKEVLCAVM